MQQLQTFWQYFYSFGRVIILSCALFGGMVSITHADSISDLITQVGKVDMPPLGRLQINPQFYQSYANASNVKPEHISILYQAEQTSTPAAQAVLQQARIMALDDKTIVKGSCWDYLNEVFGRVMVNRDKVFVGRYPDGPFVDVNAIQAGDWLYFINHSYYDGEHSGLFVGWVDEAKRQALVLSYAGEGRREPARYRVYDLSHTYHVMRPVFP